MRKALRGPVGVRIPGGKAEREIYLLLLVEVHAEMAENTQEGRMMEKEQEQIIQECICLKCLYRWIGIRPVGTKLSDLECPNCGAIWYVIGTGEVLE